MISAINDELTKPSIRDWIGPSTHVNVRKLNCTRDWKDHVSGTGVKLEGGLLRDDEGNHLFLAMQRRGRHFRTLEGLVLDHSIGYVV